MLDADALISKRMTLRLIIFAASDVRTNLAMEKDQLAMIYYFVQ